MLKILEEVWCDDLTAVMLAKRTASIGLFLSVTKLS